MVIWSGSHDGTIRRHDMREGLRWDSDNCRRIQVSIHYIENDN
jgi:hypothetical protein